MPRVPRVAWLAVGAISAALLTQERVPGAGSQGWPLVVAALVLLMVAGMRLRQRSPALAVLLIGIAVVCLRVGLGTLATAHVEVAALPRGDGPWRAVVEDVSAPSGDQQRAFLALSGSGSSVVQIREAGPAQPRWLIYAWLPRYPSLVPGDDLLVRGRIEGPPTDAPGFAGFLASRGAAGTLKAESVERLAGGAGAIAVVQQLRGSVDGWLARALPEPEAGLASGILVGLRERVSRPLSDDFTTTGLTHVVAISGWNIALVAGIVTGLLRSTGLARRPRSLLVILAIGAYTILAGAEASVVRAALMGGVVLVAREGGRPAGAAAALAIAAVLLLAIDPAMVTDAGLQLSLAATAGLLALGSASEARVRRLAPARTPGWLVEALGVSLAAQLATLPLVLFHFGRLSIISPLANVLMAPLVPLAMLGAALGALSGPIMALPLLEVLLVPLRLAAWLPLTAMVRGTALLARVPFASVELTGDIGMLSVVVSLGALGLALRRVRPGMGGQNAREPRDVEAVERPAVPESTGRRARVPRLMSLGAGVSGFVLLVIVLWPRPPGHLRISVLDVGQGDAILVEASEGLRMLVDGGSDPDLLVRRLDERIPLWDRRIDLVVLTHPHEDHAGGLAGLMPRYRVEAIAETGLALDGPGVRELRAVAARDDVEVVLLGQGDAFALGAARVDVVWPPRAMLAETGTSTNRDVNGTSVVLAIQLGEQRAVLLGDLEDDRDGELLSALPRADGPLDLLKVAHHGSATATSATLLAALRPRVAAISVGAGNDYGHPAPELLARLAEQAGTTWRTDLQGTLSIELDGHASPSERSG